MEVKAELKHWISDIKGKAIYQRFGEKERRKNRIASQISAVVMAVTAIYYIAWCFKNANWDAWYMFVPFILAELGFLALLLMWVTILWNKRHHRPAGLDRKVDRSVDIFIPVVSEPLDVIEKTVSAAMKITYEPKKVYVLDDGAKEEHKAIAEKYGAHYICRPVHQNRKAGNLNYALAHTEGELILALDADQVPQPNILDHLTGYFDLKHIAFVQTAQRFILPKGDPWANSDKIFYKAMQAAKDHDNAAISCGSGVIYRREALEDVGGFSEWNVVEDLHTSYRLHNKGWKSVFHDVAYTEGTAPEEVMSQVKQRWQWAVDSLRMIFWDSPFKKKGLSWQQKIQYFHFGFNYIAFGLCLPIFLIIPMWSLFTHTFFLPPPFYLYAVARIPYLIAQVATNRLITYHQYSFKSFQAQAGLFPTYIDAIITALLSKNKIPKYSVTSKVALKVPFSKRLWKCTPHLLLSLGSVAALIYGAYTVERGVWFFCINAVWCLWTILVLNRFIVLSLSPKPVIAS